MTLPAVALSIAGWSLRPWRESDAESLVEHADNVNVWRTLSDRFPHPYTREIAEQWVRRGHIDFGGDNLAVCLDDLAAGGCGLVQGSGDARCNVEIGYWIGEPYWGRGVASDVVRALTARAFERPEVARVVAPVHAHNAASMRVLANNGFIREGLLRQSKIKAGRVIDVELWARYRAG